MDADHRFYRIGYIIHPHARSPFIEVLFKGKAMRYLGGRAKTPRRPSIARDGAGIVVQKPEVLAFIPFNPFNLYSRAASWH
jgi:hypothetical protein